MPLHDSGRASLLASRSIIRDFGRASLLASRSVIRLGRSLALPEHAGDLAIVGLSAQFGPFDGKESLRISCWSMSNEPAASKPRNAWGIPESAFCESNGKESGAFAGFYIDSLEFGIDQFRIPPKELGEMQPQQSLMLRVAARGDRRCALGCAARRFGPAS